MGSLSKLDISGNQICGLDEDGRGTHDTSGFAVLTKSIGNLKELNISNNFLKAQGAEILVPALEANGSLSSLHLGQSNIPEEQMKAIIAMDKFDVLCAVPVRELKADSITELDLAGKSLGVEGALVLATYLKEDSGSLSKLMFGDGESDYIKKDKCTGESFEVGQAVVYKGKQCIVSQAVDRDGERKVRFFFSITVEVGMTEADFSGANMGESGAIILAAWLTHKVQHMTPK
jgi:hypothetical protein